MPFDPLSDFDAEILRFLEGSGVDTSLVDLQVPAQREFGERSTNVAFRLAKERRQAPRQIAQDIASGFDPAGFRSIARVEAAGNGFINFYLDYDAFVPFTIASIQEAGDRYGRKADVSSLRIVVEHTSVNPNKEWHVGHLRNAVLGDVVAATFSLAGHDVQVQNYIDDTGLQAATSVYALTEFPEPQRPDEKFDHYAGRPYVKISAELASEASLRKRLSELTAGGVVEDRGGVTGIGERESIEARLANIERLKAGIMRTMHALEEGEYRPIVDRILQAQLETAWRLGIFYDLLNWESDLVGSHTFQQAMDVVNAAPQVYRPDEGHYAGALVIRTGDAEGPGGEPKAEVLIGSNGLPTYVAKDIAYHMWKFGLLPDRLRYVRYLDEPNGNTLWSTALHGDRRIEPTPDRVINIIAVDQSLAQATVKDALRVTGYPREAEDLFHLAYGLVSTAEGKLSGRKGTSASADSIIDEAVRVALERVHEKGEELEEGQAEHIAEAVGVGAVRYFMTQYNPLRDIVFDVKDVVSYDGNTALYVQYALVRMFAILRKAAHEQGISAKEIDSANAHLLQHEQERRLIFHLALFPQTVTDVTRTLSVNLLAEYAFDLATIFSQFYRDCGVLNAEPELRAARLLLVRTVRDVLAHVCGVLGLPVIERL